MSNATKIDILIYLSLIIISISIFLPVILETGSIFNLDFLDILQGSDYFRSWNYLWNSYGSYPTLEYLPRIIFTIITAVFTSSDILTKGMLLVGFLVASLSTYYSIKLFFKDKTNAQDIIFLNISSFIGALFYAFNVWSFNRIVHWFLWIPYTILPLLFISIIYFFRNNKKSRYIFATIIIWSLASMSLHTAIFFGLIIIGIFSFIILRDIKDNKNVTAHIKSLFLIIILYTAINLYWIYPYIRSSILTTFSPSYIVTEEVIQMLSRDNNFNNVFRLVENWWLPRIINPVPLQNSFLFPIWLFASYLIPILAFSSWILDRKNKYTLYFSLLAILAIYLTMGSKAPFNIYSNIVFDIPLISKHFGWILRDPDKLAFLIAFTYSFLVAIASFNIMKILRGGRYEKILIGFFLMLVFMSIAIYSYPTYKDIVEKMYNPIMIPDDFYNLKDNLSKINTEKVFNIPISTYKTVWSKNHTVGRIYYMSSEKPNIQLISPTSKNYYNYFTGLMISNRTYDINNFIYPLGTSYIVFHNDTIDPNDEILLNKLYSLDKIKNIDNVGFFKIFKTEDDIGQINIAKQNIILTGGINIFATIDFLDNFNSINSSLFFLEQGVTKYKYNYARNADFLIGKEQNDLMYSFIDEKYLVKPFDITVRHDPKDVWSKAGTNDPLHGPWHPYIQERKIDNWDFDYGKGIVFTWSNSIDKDVIPSEKDLLNTYKFENGIDGWSINTEEQTLQLSNNAYSGKYSIQILSNGSKRGWKSIDSPLILINYKTSIKWQFYIKGENTHDVHAKIMEYNSDKKIINTNYITYIGTGSFDWNEISFNYIPEKKNVTYIQLQIWHGHEMTQSLPKKIWIDDVKIYDLSKNPVTLDMDLNVDHENKYELFIRYFENKDGGKINISIDGKTIKSIGTKDQLNKFVWKKIATLNLKKGRYKLTLINDEGFNAVNIFALIPKNEFEEMEKNIGSLIEGKKLIYIFEAESDLYSNYTKILRRYGGKASNGEVIYFNNRSIARQNISIIRKDNYKMALKLNGKFHIKIDNNNYNVSSNTSDFVYIGPLFLKKGNHKIELKKDNNSNIGDLDVIWLYSVKNKEEKLEDIFRVNETPAKVSNYTKIDPTLYKMKINATKPFMISFAESYDPLWTAKIDNINGKSINSDVIRPIPLYSVVNGFWINQTGDLDITIEYEPQRWFYIGATISITTLIICIGYLVYDWRRKKTN